MDKGVVETPVLKLSAEKSFNLLDLYDSTPTKDKFSAATMFARVRKSKVNFCSSWDMLNHNTGVLQQNKSAEVLKAGNHDKNFAAWSLKEKVNVVKKRSESSVDYDVLNCQDPANVQLLPPPPSPSFVRVPLFYPTKDKFSSAKNFARNSNILSATSRSAQSAPSRSAGQIFYHKFIYWK